MSIDQMTNNILKRLWSIDEKVVLTDDDVEFWNTHLEIAKKYYTDNGKYWSEKQEIKVKRTQHHIYHSIGNGRFQEIDVQRREYAGYVDAKDLDEAYRRAQNEKEYWNKHKPCRSTSVGDVIQNDDGFWMVCDVGFKNL